jgi:hypothetical protein
MTRGADQKGTTMRGLLQFLRPARSPKRQSSTERGRRSPTPCFRPKLEMLEDRSVPSTVSSIVSNFNGTRIPAGDTIWFSSVFKPSGLGSAPVTLHVTNQTISFSAGGTNYSIAVPDSLITLSPTVTVASTTFDAGTNTWDITVPTSFSGNALLGGVAFQVTTPLPGGINPVTWTASFSTDTAGFSLNWQWAAAVYTNFSGDYNALGVKPLDANKGTIYSNSDHAGTPENFRTFVTGGARGGGGSNFTGSLSPTSHVTPGVETGSASISGFVYNDANTDGLFDMGDSGLSGVTITLTGTDSQGHSVNMTAVTDINGFYQFTGLLAGTYTLTESFVPGFVHDPSNPGTVNGNPDGGSGIGQITGIVLNAGDNGVNYDFGEVIPNS